MAKLGMKPDWSWGILIYLGCGKTLEDLDFPEYKYIYIYHLVIQHSRGKSLFFMGVLVGKSSINGPSIAMATLNNQRVYIYIYISQQICGSNWEDQIFSGKVGFQAETVFFSLGRKRTSMNIAYTTSFTLLRGYSLRFNKKLTMQIGNMNHQRRAFWSTSPPRCIISLNKKYRFMIIYGYGYTCVHIVVEWSFIRSQYCLSPTSRKKIRFPKSWGYP